MSRLTWILYLLGTALVFGSYLGLVSAEVAWIGWIVASGIALWSWWPAITQRCRRREAVATRSPFTAEEEAAARREVHGDEDPQP